MIKTYKSALLMTLILIVAIMGTIAIFVKLHNLSVVNNNELYQISTKNNFIYINENGDEIIKIDKKKYDIAGEFSEGKIFAAKIIKTLEETGFYEEYLVKISMLDGGGNLIKDLPFNVIVAPNYDVPDRNLPKFSNSTATLTLEDNTNVTINDKGEKINVVANNSNDVDVNADIDDGFYHSREYPIDKLALQPFAYGGSSGDKYIAYKNSKGKVVIDLKTSNPYGSGDITRDVHFYNGVAMVFGGFTDPQRRFINTKGKYINNEIYDYATPFWKKLAVVSVGYKYGYINTKGKWVWSATYDD